MKKTPERVVKRSVLTYYVLGDELETLVVLIHSIRQGELPRQVFFLTDKKISSKLTARAGRVGL